MATGALLHPGGPLFLHEDSVLILHRLQPEGALEQVFDIMHQSQAAGRRDRRQGVSIAVAESVVSSTISLN